MLQNSWLLWIPGHGIRDHIVWACWDLWTHSLIQSGVYKVVTNRWDHKPLTLIPWKIKNMSRYFRFSPSSCCATTAQGNKCFVLLFIVPGWGRQRLTSTRATSWAEYVRLTFLPLPRGRLGCSWSSSRTKDLFLWAVSKHPRGLHRYRLKYFKICILNCGLRAVSLEKGKSGMS